MSSHRSLHVLLIGLGILAIALILWVDITTDLWQEYVVIAGLAGGLITFVLTALVIDRLIARSEHERWAPVTRLALGDLRRRLAAEPERHEVARSRRLPEPASPAELDRLIVAATQERDALAAALAPWAAFLAASADVAETMDGIAELAERLDRVGELAMQLRRAFDVHEGTNARGHASEFDELRTEIREVHRIGDALLATLQRQLEADADRPRRVRSAQRSSTPARSV